MRTNVVDGNFTADHIKQKRPDDDIWLTDGEGMMAAREPYYSHIKAAKDIKEVCSSISVITLFLTLYDIQKHLCEPLESTFRAVMDANVGSSIKDVNGVVTHACARHGCYCPGSIVNLPKGEKQSSVDFSTSETAKTTHMENIKLFLQIYDLACIYHVKLPQRFRDAARYLTMPDMILDRAIGMFHVHGHQDSCFFRYATSFIKGAAMVDGEILETLWAVLNLISQSVRTASLAHRAEIIDDHTNDSNWKKLVSIRMSTCLVRRPTDLPV